MKMGVVDNTFVKVNAKMLWVKVRLPKITENLYENMITLIGLHLALNE